MPDLTIEIMEMCATMDQRYSVQVGDYTVHTYQGEPVCTCPAFKFGKTRPCKHIRRMQENQCNWHEQYSDEMQVFEGVCPRCGGPTVKVRVAV